MRSSSSRIATAFRSFERYKRVKIFLYYIGKARDAHANAMAEEYIKRSDAFRQMRDAGDSTRGGSIRGKSTLRRRRSCSTRGPRAGFGRSFAQLIGERDLVFVIGGAEGLPAEWRDRARICCWRCRR